jgi:alpha-beta hydrolase superfamily lysophospholipase
MNKVCWVIKVVTPKKLVLNGLWFGPEKVKRVLVFVHGLTSNVFAHHDYLLPLVNKETAVVFFNNRGHDLIARFKKIDRRRKKGYESKVIGMAHEVFTDCVDDLDGVVNFVRKKGVKEVYLVGHSTGCQKSIYFLSRRGKQKLVKGVVLIAPMSDWAAAVKMTKAEDLERAEKWARKMVKEGKKDELLPKEVWPWINDAQRYLSLNTPESKEEIFTYGQEEKIPTTMHKVKSPTLVILAEKDEYRDRPMTKIAKWFEENSRSKDLKVEVVEGALHGFGGFEKDLAEAIKNWMNM